MSSSAACIFFASSGSVPRIHIRMRLPRLASDTAAISFRLFGLPASFAISTFVGVSSDSYSAGLPRPRFGLSGSTFVVAETGAPLSLGFVAVSPYACAASAGPDPHPGSRSRARRRSRTRPEPEPDPTARSLTSSSPSADAALACRDRPPEHCSPSLSRAAARPCSPIPTRPGARGRSRTSPRSPRIRRRRCAKCGLLSSAPHIMHNLGASSSTSSASPPSAASAVDTFRRNPRSRHVRRRLHVEQPLRCPASSSSYCGSGLDRQWHGLRHVQARRLIPLAVPYRHRNQPAAVGLVRSPVYSSTAVARSTGAAPAPLLGSTRPGYCACAGARIPAPSILRRI